MNFKCISVLLICFFVISESVDRRNRDWHNKKGWRKNRKHGAPRKLLKFPSGKMYKITYPSVFKKGHCPTKATKIPLNPTGKMGKIEYDIVKREIEATAQGKSFNIQSIEKLSNPCLWYRYKMQQKTIERSSRRKNERMLFHGSPAALSIVNEGFNEGYAAAGYFGYGLYFADLSAKSYDYAQPQAGGKRYLLLCRVTLGRIHKEAKPMKYPNPPPRHDSVVSSALPQTEYIVYKGEQAYPEYLVTFT